MLEENDHENELDYNKIQNAEEAIKRFKELDSQRNSLELFQMIAQKAKITYLDQHKLYAIVQVKYLQELESIAQTSRSKIAEIFEKTRAFGLENAVAGKMISSKDDKILELKREKEELLRERSQLFAHIKYLSESLRQKQTELQMRILHSENLRGQAKNSRGSFKKICSNESDETPIKKMQRFREEYAQTQFCDDTQDLIHKVSDLIHEPEEMQERDQQFSSTKIHQDKNEQDMKKLKEKFADILKDISSQLNEKIEEIRVRQIEQTKWYNQAHRLMAEVGELKQKLKDINEKEEKIEIWRSMMSGLVNKIEENVEDSDEMIIDESEEIAQNGHMDEEEYCFKQKIRILEDKILKLEAEKIERKDRAEEVRKLMEFEQQISQQNIVNNMLVLSRKIKETVQFILEQA